MKVSRRLRRLFRRRQTEAEMAEEMRFHLEQRTADYAGDGLSDDEARYAAQRKFGNVGRAQEYARDSYGWGWLERILKDLQLGARNLAASPGFTVLAIVTLALGIGANTSMFSAMNAILLRPLPYPDGANLDRIDRKTPEHREGRVSPADYLDLRREMHGYGEIAAYELRDTSLAEPGRPAEMARALRGTANLFSVLGLQPQLGRAFRPKEEIPGNDRVVIISRRCWLHRFGGRADIIGHTVRIDREPHEIIGVMPEAMNESRHLGAIDLFRPLALEREKAADRQSLTIRLHGRRSPTLSRAEADAFIANFGARLAADHPEIHAGASWYAEPLIEKVMDRNGRKMMTMLVCLSGFVLLIGCSNLANLLLARAIARAREFAVRSALGASRVQLLRPLIAESLLLALAGGVCAILVALWVGDYLAVRSTADNGEHVRFTVDWRVLGWTFGASLVTAVAFGLAPALFALRINLTNTLKSGGRGSTGGRGHRQFRHALIVGQFALAMVLLAGAALFIRGIDELNDRRAGWKAEHLVTGTIVLPTAGYPTDERVTAFHRLAVERLEALPGVAAAGISSFTPFFDWPLGRRYLVEGREPPKPGQEPVAGVNSVSPRYFETIGTRVIAGRAFNERDTATSRRVFIINQAMAAALFGSEEPIGRRLARAGSPDADWGEIVGVAADVKSVIADSGPVAFQLYQPMVQEPGRRNEISVRTAGVATSALIDGIRRAITALDPDLPVHKLQPAEVSIHRANYPVRVLRDMLAAMAVLGLALALLGIYGVIARAMAQRTTEFAIRLAFGASLGDITRIVLTAGVRLALLGSALGLIGAGAVSRLIASSFPGMHFESPPVLIGTTLLLIAVAVFACWLPARRASKVDAMMALRAE